ncbi:MAG: hypothetical protein E5W81_25320, partial [Mesorhizobium sp.]
MFSNIITFDRPKINIYQSPVKALKFMPMPASTTPVSITIATRDWDYLTPLVLGDVTSSRLSVKFDRVATLIPDLGTNPHRNA